MIEPISIISDIFIICLIILIIWAGVKFLYKLATIGQTKDSYDEDIDRKLWEDSKEDSEGDGLMLFDDPLFPEEFDEDEDY